jgi:hypothetical protein
MKITKELLELGINENILQNFHNNTNNKEYEIISASKSKWSYGSTDGNIVVNLTLSNGKLVQYNINISKIRQKQINRLLSGEN